MFELKNNECLNMFEKDKYLKNNPSFVNYTSLLYSYLKK